MEQNIALARFTTWRVGGPAKYLFQPQSRAELVEFLQHNKNADPLFWLGLGSNLLIRDGGFPGIVINTLTGLHQIKQLDDHTVWAEAGVACAQVARFCARFGLQGVEFLAGIPGTLGGALAMNAGCFGGETWNHVQRVETINSKGEIHERFPTEFKIGYRQVEKPAEEWFVSGTLQLQPGKKEQSLEKIKQLLAHRAATQPTGEHNCGSVFRNPAGDHAGRLIEACGLKGFQMGGAEVSAKHANFIINQGAASAQDIENLISHVQHCVKEKYNIDLIREVQIIGIEPKV